MFVGVELARRIEATEARSTSAMAACIREPIAIVHELGAGIAAVTEPGSPINKVIGIGFQPIDERALAEIERAWQSRGEPVRIEISTLADPEIFAMLATRGYRLTGFENVLGLPLTTRSPSVSLGDRSSDTTTRSPVVQVEPVDASTDAIWREIFVTGFTHPDGTGTDAQVHEVAMLERLLQDVARQPGLHRYLARIDDGTPAGGASLRIDDAIAQLAGATTLVPHRRRGVQQALLHARLADARNRGCELAIMTTSPGSQSQANAHRQGFTLLYARALLIRP